MPQFYCSSLFTEAATKRGKQTLSVYHQTVPMALSSFLCVCSDGQNRTIVRGTGTGTGTLNQSTQKCVVLQFGVKQCPVEVWYKTQTPYIRAHQLYTLIYINAYMLSVVLIVGSEMHVVRHCKYRFVIFPLKSY